MWWLCWEAAANESLPVEFPDHRENTGNFIEIELMVHARGERPQWICDEIPYYLEQGIYGCE